MQLVQHGFDYDDRSVHNQSEIQCPQAHQVTAHAKQIHHNDGKQHRQRYDGGNQKSCPEISEEQDQYKDHDQGSFGKVGLNGADGIVDHLGTVEKRFNDHTFGQCFLDNGNAFFHIFDNFGTIGSLEHHHHRTGHLPLIVVGHSSIACGIARFHFGNIFQQYRNTILRSRDRNVFYIYFIIDQSFATDIKHGRAFFDISTSGILVVIFQCREYVTDAEVQRLQFVGIDRNFILFQLTSEAADFGNTFYT